MDSILNWIDDNGPYIVFLWTIVFPILFHFGVFYTRRNDERKYQERFNLYKTLVLDKTSQLFVELHDDCQFFQKYSANNNDADHQIILGEIETHKEKVFVKFCLPTKLFDENLYDDLQKAIEVFYTEFAILLMSFSKAKQAKEVSSNELLIKSSNAIVEILKSGVPTLHNKSTWQKHKYKLINIFSKTKKLQKILKHLVFFRIT